MGEVRPHPAASERALSAPARFSSSHRLERFDCEKPALNDWLREHAGTSEGRTARTYVVCEGAEVVGYYCISSGSIERGALPSKMKRERGLPKQIPVAIIGRLARDVRYKGTRLGEDLLRDALARIIGASETIGVRAVLVYALDEDAARFWRKHGFTESPLGSRTFYLAIETAIEAIGE